MKGIFTALILVVSMTTSALAQKSTIDDVIVTLRAGNAAELSKYCDDNVLLTLPDKSDSYTRAQSQQILRDFFANNGVKGFELKHKGESPGGHYFIGTLQTKSGNFRAHVFLQTKGNRELIKEIRFQIL